MPRDCTCDPRQLLFEPGKKNTTHAELSVQTCRSHDASIPAAGRSPSLSRKSICAAAKPAQRVNQRQYTSHRREENAQELDGQESSTQRACISRSDGELSRSRQRIPLSPSRSLASARMERSCQRQVLKLCSGDRSSPCQRSEPASTWDAKEALPALLPPWIRAALALHTDPRSPRSLEKNKSARGLV